MGNAFVPFVVIVRSALTALVLASLVASSSIRELTDLVFGLPTHNQQLQYWHHSCSVPLERLLLPFVSPPHVDHPN